MSPLHPRLLAVVLCAVAFHCPANAQSATPDGSRQSASQDAAASESETSNLPDSPGTTWAKAQEPSAQSSSSQEPSAPEADSKAASERQEKLQRPVGTAAAEAPNVSGITAAQPAGVAIAPAKQRHVRTIVLKVGAVLAAGAAVGTVVALTAATPSKPPGAH